MCSVRPTLTVDLGQIFSESSNLYTLSSTPLAWYESATRYSLGLFIMCSGCVCWEHCGLFSCVLSLSLSSLSLWGCSLFECIVLSWVILTGVTEIPFSTWLISLVPLVCSICWLILGPPCDVWIFWNAVSAWLGWVLTGLLLITDAGGEKTIGVGNKPYFAGV